MPNRPDRATGAEFRLKLRDRLAGLEPATPGFGDMDSTCGFAGRRRPKRLLRANSRASPPKQQQGDEPMALTFFCRALVGSGDLFEGRA
jgi:hypothetical protein